MSVATSVRSTRPAAPSSTPVTGRSPASSGTSARDALARDPSLGSTRLIALTGYAQREDVQQALDAGFHRHVAKPLDIDEIARVLA
jgi:CheY-like chemotaxis protein